MGIIYKQHSSSLFGCLHNCKMGLYTVIKKHKQKSKEMRILILGLDNAGKSSITNQLLLMSGIDGSKIEPVAPTFGFTIKSLQLNGTNMNLWDVGGQKCLRPFWQNYFESTDGLIWVIDSSDVSRLADCQAELFNLLKEEQLQARSDYISNT